MIQVKIFNGVWLHNIEACVDCQGRGCRGRGFPIAVKLTDQSGARIKATLHMYTILPIQTACCMASKTRAQGRRLPYIVGVVLQQVADRVVTHAPQREPARGRLNLNHMDIE